MAVFADTSGFYAVLAREDANYQRAQTAWRSLASADETVISHSYVVSETFALVQRRLGMDAVGILQHTMLHSVQIVWVDLELHETATRALLTHQNRRIGLVDHVSFEVMRRLGIATAFAFDDDFRQAGFTLLG
jgi:predicted nucleic acid-binding protein